MQGIDRHRLRRKNRSTVLLPLPESKSILLDRLIFLSEMNPRHAERAGQESRLPPAAGGRRDSWRSSQRRQRRAGAVVGFGNCKRACEASSSPSAPAKRQFSPVGLSCFFVRAGRRRTSKPKDLAFCALQGIDRHQLRRKNRSTVLLPLKKSGKRFSLFSI